MEVSRLLGPLLKFEEIAPRRPEVHPLVARNRTLGYLDHVAEDCHVASRIKVAHSEFDIADSEAEMVGTDVDQPRWGLMGPIR
ncbi:Uncharacterised protein [Mycobacteroides abscessus subsp. abscessus]|nr:Uncharacterised protein [Mycobacteroides abscessus subsp. abscessus]